MFTSLRFRRVGVRVRVRVYGREPLRPRLGRFINLLCATELFVTHMVHKLTSIFLGHFRASSYQKRTP